MIRKFYKIYNKNTGEIKIIDPVEAKNKRKRKKITAWAKMYSDLVNTGYSRKKPYDGIFVTLTYVNDEKLNDANIRSYIKLIRERLKDKLISYAWVCENQKRGIPHYHIMFIVKKGVKIDKPDNKDWKGGSSNIQKVIKGVWYLISYCKKVYDSYLPKGWRCFSVFARDEIKQMIRIECLPDWLIYKCKEEGIYIKGIIKKVTGGYYINEKMVKTDWDVCKNLVTGNIEIYQMEVI